MDGGSGADGGLDGGERGVTRTGWTWSNGVWAGMG